MTMNVMTTMTKSNEGTSLLKRGDNQTHDKIRKDRMGSGELTAMVIFTKNQLHCQIKWGSVYKGFSF